MNATVPYSIPKESSSLPAVLLAIAVHTALFAFLWFGVRWQNTVPVAMEAEVWDMTPIEAAPPAPEPVAVKETPKPVETQVEKPIQKPDIALEQEKKRRELEQKQREQEELQKKADAETKKKQELKEKALLEKTRQEAMNRMLAQAGAGKGNAAKSQGPRGDPDYLARIVAKIRSNTYFPTPPDLTGNPTVEYELGLLPDGSLMGIRLIHSSGLPGFDEAVHRGIQNSEPFPADKSGVVPRDLIITYKLKE